jgi:ABC-type lipoprotein export system ATPase subunit
VLIGNPSVGQNLVDRKSFYISIPQLTTTIDGDDTTILDYVGATENMWLSLTHKLAVPWGNAAFGCVACAAQDRTVACQEQLLAALVLYGNGAVPGTQLLELVGLFIAQRNPRARGHVELSSSNFRDNLRVFDGWNTRIEDLSEDALHDLSVLVDGAYELLVDLVRNTSYIEKLGHPVSNRTGEFAAETVLALEELKGLFSNLSNECKVSAAFGLNCSSWTECTPTLPPLPLDRETLTTVIFNTLASSQHGAGTCQVGKVVNKRSFQVLGVQSLHIADLSILDAATDVHPMLTAMAIGALAGNQIDSLGEELPESFPVVFAIVMVVLATLFSLVVIGFQFFTSSKPSSKNSETGGSVPLPIWLKQSLLASGPLPTGRSHAFVSASNADAATNTADVPPEEGKIAPVTPNLLAWHRLCCSYKMKSGEDKVTLSNASGAMRQGELVAIMGASGGGKSTLLDILSGRKSIGNVTGTLSVVGTEINDAKEASKLLREVSAYIPQQEAFYPTQSSQEAVLFTARLKLGVIFTQDDAQSLLDAVGLKEEVSKRPIGGTLPGGIVIRGLSGGERKRLALACAVAIKPRLLFLDEITRYAQFCFCLFFHR